MSLQDLGWNSERESGFAPRRERGLVPARVAREDRGRCLLLDGREERTGVPAGTLRRAAARGAAWPAAGDWVAVPGGSGGVAAIREVLPRTSAFARKAAGATTREQVIAANVDVVLLVTGLDHDFNPRRIERYLAAAWESGAAPVLVLNKSDLADDPGACGREAEAVAPGVPVLVLSARTGDGLDALGPFLSPGRTVALLGSSGAGKSTIANALLGVDRQETAAVRADDSRGRHTTVRRELIPLPGGALLLDTPGLRELLPWDAEGGLERAFPEIAALAGGCRFRDCSHGGEPGCAVRAAADDGRLDPARLESWRKLRAEQRWLDVRRDARGRAEEERRWKQIARAIRRHPKADRWR